MSNFRGIKTLNWTIPVDQRLFCLIGPGDSGKSSILDALHLLLGDRWNPTFADTDFYDSDVSDPIVIRAVVSDVPAALLKETAFGLWLSGIDSEGELHPDPSDGMEPCLILNLDVGQSLEPVWSVQRVGGDAKALSSSSRQELATFKIDDRADIHLRWNRTSALGRMSPKEGGAKSAMALASRAAGKAIADFEDEGLDGVIANVQKRANAIGGRFLGMHHGLDTSGSSNPSNLALYEGSVPLSGFGLGTKRLTAMAVQQLAAGQRSTLLADEIEHGLEPHRLVSLLQHLLSDENYSQVFITTHSAVVVEQAKTESLAIVRNDSGKCVVHTLAGDGGDLALRLRRSRPSSFLARKIVVVEGKTEHGLLMSFVDHWDAGRLADGFSIAAGEGAVIQDGQGGSEVPVRTDALRGLGYEVAALVDNDDRTIDVKVFATEAAGTTVFRWDEGHNIETQLAGVLDEDGLDLLLQLGIAIRNDDLTVILDLRRQGLPKEIKDLGVAAWIEAGLGDLPAFRAIIGETMVKSSWFKNVDLGRQLGDWLIANETLVAGTRLEHVLNGVHEFIYPAVIDPESSTTND